MPLLSNPMRFPVSTSVLSSELLFFWSFSNFGEPPLISSVCLLSVNVDPFVKFSVIMTSGKDSIFRRFACTSDSRGPSLCGSKSNVSFLFLYIAEVILGLFMSVRSLDFRVSGSSVLKWKYVFNFLFVTDTDSVDVGDEA